MPQVSVIIPNYNHAPYLKQRVESVLAQTFEDFELIILDDKSTDNSREVLDGYRQHPKVTHLIYNTTNSGGPFNQWKKGIDLALGKYIWIAESDDWCEPNLLQTLVNGLDNNPTCVLAFAQSYTINGDNDIQQVSAYPKLQDVINGRSYIKEYLSASCSIWNASAVLFKKEAYQNISPRYTTFKMSGDWAFYIEMLTKGDIFISGKVLNYFRNHDKDVSGKMYASGMAYVEEIKILNLLKQDGLITTAEFKEHLLNKYVKFLVFKYKFTADVKSAIEQALFGDDNAAYKQFLKLNGRTKLFKIKLMRRIGLILKQPVDGK